MTKFTYFLTMASVLAFGLPAGAQNQGGGVNIGTLSCHESGGWGFIFGSSHDVHCTFSNGGKVEYYEGDISKFGVDIGYRQSGVIVWQVIAPNLDPGPDALDGHYGGATAEGAVGVGLGANVLIGGSSKTIALQPISIEGATGVNVAAGIGELTLRSRRGG